MSSAFRKFLLHCRTHVVGEMFLFTSAICTVLSYDFVMQCCLLPVQLGQYVWWVYSCMFARALVVNIPRLSIFSTVFLYFSNGRHVISLYFLSRIYIVIVSFVHRFSILYNCHRLICPTLLSRIYIISLLCKVYLILLSLCRTKRFF